MLQEAFGVNGYFRGVVDATLDVAMLERDVIAAVEALRARPDVDRRIGFCIGGYAAILTGRVCDMQSIVAFDPGGLVHVRPNVKLVPRLRELRAPTMLQLGGADTGQRCTPRLATDARMAFRHAASVRTFAP